MHKKSVTKPDLEWDETKRQWTLRERGLDFAALKELDWDKAFTLQELRNGEVRYFTIGPIRGRLHVAAWCFRGIRLRVISFRKANKREIEKYERALHG